KYKGQTRQRSQEIAAELREAIHRNTFLREINPTTFVRLGVEASPLMLAHNRAAMTDWEVPEPSGNGQQRPPVPVEVCRWDSRRVGFRVNSFLMCVET